jgi:hypothetical protein
MGDDGGIASWHSSSRKMICCTSFPFFQKPSCLVHKKCKLILLIFLKIGKFIKFSTKQKHPWREKGVLIKNIIINLIYNNLIVRFRPLRLHSYLKRLLSILRQPLLIKSLYVLFHESFESLFYSFTNR